MKKSIILLLFVIFAFANTSWGQKTKFQMIMFDLRYEYHPVHLSFEDLECEYQNTHMGKLGIWGFRFKFGENHRHSIEWHPLNLTVSSSPDEPYGISFTDFVFRTGKGRFKASLYLDLWEFTRNKIIDKNVIHYSIAGGVDTYLTDFFMLNFNLGVTLENDENLPDGFFSPFVGIGIKYDIEDKKKHKVNWDHVIY